MHETYDTNPAFKVQDVEFHRLLGYPRAHPPGERALELMAWARNWYAQHGRPWVYLRRVELQLTDNILRLGGVQFRSQQLHDHLWLHGAQSAMLLAVSAGRECEEHARQLWTEGKPDEYFFLEVYGSAVVEDLVARTNGRICDLAGHNGLMAVPHYSPGYSGWDIAEQHKLFSLIAQGMTKSFPGPIEVLSSGMLRPKKSLLGVFGLAPAKARDASAPAPTPCENCSFSPCQYRRTPYRHVVGPVSDRTSSQSQTGPTMAADAEPALEPLTRNAKYSVNARALRKWATERVRLDLRDDGKVEAVFRFDGTTCSNMGRPLAFDYRVTLSGPDQGYRILETACRPAPGDEGYQYTCAYLSDPEKLMQALADEKPLRGRPLDEVLAWTRAVAPSGCHCTADSRTHKWGLALEVIHYALLQARVPQAVS